jgi:hypothetical protein
MTRSPSSRAKEKRQFIDRFLLHFSRVEFTNHHQGMVRRLRCKHFSFSCRYPI